ncbi:hypothetical protein WJX84_008621 [Apatococcus fuscideae]|uniref:peptidyl-tRNA hydrolase n=1 Tax=Apatococcus fuscideae TaxID=2026836 RepID=A0AAW1SMF9_9CHLO
MDSAGQFFLEQLEAMGFSHLRASKALHKTHNVGIEPAVTWLAEHMDDPDLDQPMTEQMGRPSSGVMASSSNPVLGIPTGSPLVMHPDGAETPAFVSGVGCECKVVLVVAQDLGMSPGKLAAQCAHAAVGLYKLMAHRRVPWLAAWEATGEKTVVLAINSSRQLPGYVNSAEALQLPAYIVRDAGRTEIAAGSVTVAAIGGQSEKVDQITGRLKTF